MASPQRVKIDRQGRLVVPQALREDLIEVPGELLAERTPDGLLLRPVNGRSRVRMAADGLPILEIERVLTNDEVLAAIDRQRDER